MSQKLECRTQKLRAEKIEFGLPMDLLLPSTF